MIPKALQLPKIDELKFDKVNINSSNGQGSLLGNIVASKLTPLGEDTIAIDTNFPKKINWESPGKCSVMRGTEMSKKLPNIEFNA